MTAPDRRLFLQHAAGALAAVALSPELAHLRAWPAGRAPLGVGLVGAGRQGRAILGELAKLEGVSVIGVCDSDESRLSSGLRRVRGAEGFADHRALLEAQGVDALLIATPTHQHRQIALDALAAKKHVYCEAPLAASIEDSRAIARAARTAGTIFQTGLLGRTNPIYALARSFYRAGALRESVSLFAQDCQKNSWRTPVSDPSQERARNWRLDPEVSLGLPGEAGSHQFDVFHWFRSEYPLSVRGGGGVLVHADGREVFDTASCELLFPGGVRLSWEGTLGSTYGGTYELLRGAMGSMKLAWTHGWMFKESDAPTQGWEVYANRETFFNDQGITLIADATQLASQGKLKEGVGLPEPSLYYALSAFARSIATGTAPECTAEVGHRAAVVGILAQRAVTSGETLPITDADLAV